MKLTEENVAKVLKECFVDKNTNKDNTEPITINGILVDVVLDKKKIVQQRASIHALIENLPDELYESNGGFHYIMIGYTIDGVQSWTQQVKYIEALLALGMAAGYIKIKDRTKRKVMIINK